MLLNIGGVTKALPHIGITLPSAAAAVWWQHFWGWDCCLGFRKRRNQKKL